MNPLNNKPTEERMNTFLQEAGQALAMSDGPGLMTLINELYAEAYSAGYNDCEHENM